MAEKEPRRVVQVLGYSAFFFTCFLLFCYWTFPYDRVKDFIVARAETDLGAELEIIDLSPSWLTGVEVEGVRVAFPPEDAESPPMDLLIPEATLRVSLLSLLTGGFGGTLTAEVAGGTIDAGFDRAGEEMELEIEMDSIDLRQIGPIRAKVGIPVSGVLSGGADISLPADPSGASGNANLRIAGLSVGNGEAKLRVGGMRDGITIETLNLGDLEMGVDIEAGEARFTTFQAHGPDAKLDGGGTVRIGNPPGRSRLNLLLRLKFEDAYRERNSRTRALFSLVDMTPQLRAARTSDGALQYRVVGMLDRRIRTDAAGRARMPGADDD